MTRSRKMVYIAIAIAVALFVAALLVGNLGGETHNTFTPVNPGLVQVKS
jgi:hypothetical protein